MDSFAAAVADVPCDSERLLVIASNAGALKHPAWYLNLVAHPDLTVEIGTETYPARAVVLEGDDRQKMWEHIVQQYPFFGEHQAKIDRQIPVVEILRR